MQRGNAAFNLDSQVGLYTDTVKKLLCVDSLDSGDDWVNDCLRLPYFLRFYQQHNGQL